MLSFNSVFDVYIFGMSDTVVLYANNRIESVQNNYDKLKIKLKRYNQN